MALLQPRRALRYYSLRLQRLRGEPRGLALGVAIGVFIGITPTIPLHSLLIIALTLACRASTLAGILASWLVSNPATFVLQYYLSWWLGEALLRRGLCWSQVQGVVACVLSEAPFLERLSAVCRLGLDSLSVLLVGGAVLALPFGLVSYFVAWRFFRMLAKRRPLRSGAARTSEE
ncbi:MAG: DUF2062 domain-containing protein [Thermodesulfobacteriota bacterium]